MLHLFQSNRLETLLEQLAAEVARPQSKPLASETIIVQSKGMGRWISMGLAAKQSICANVRFPLPASALWELLRGVFGELPVRSAFSPEAMTFRLMDWLSKPQNLKHTPILANYLRGGDDLNAVKFSRHSGMDCRNPGSMDGFELTIPYDCAQDRPWHWIPASRRV